MFSVSISASPSSSGDGRWRMEAAVLLRVTPIPLADGFSTENGFVTRRDIRSGGNFLEPVHVLARWRQRPESRRGLGPLDRGPPGNDHRYTRHIEWADLRENRWDTLPFAERPAP